MGAIDELMARHTAGLTSPTCCETGLPTKPRLRATVLTCMDSRIDLFRVLGLKLGEAHVLRNAGGLATDDAIRSLVLSQHKLGTQEIMVIQHTSCGLKDLHDEELAAHLEDRTGAAPPFDFGGFDDLDASVRDSVLRLRDCPWLERRDAIRGFVYDVDSFKLREVY